jgi:Na+/H+ antiporter NhaC
MKKIRWEYTSKILIANKQVHRVKSFSLVHEYTNEGMNQMGKPILIALLAFV